MPGYRIGVDMGGTFTDAFMLSDDGIAYVAKVDTQSRDLLGTTANSLTALADQLDLEVTDLLPQVRQFMLGTTLTTNLLVTMSGVPAGLITTRGHRDILQIAGGAQGKIAGLTDDDIRHSGALDKPAPLVSKERIFEVDERVDYKGDVLVALAERQVRDAVEELRDAGVLALAVGFLWSFKNPAHELRAAEIAAEVAPDIDITCSHRLVSRLGEYLRFSSAAINAYCAPVLRRYLEEQTAWLRERGLRSDPLIMQASGGVIPAADAADTSLYTIDSGPVAGVVGAAELAAKEGGRSVICTDMGGTTFDVGLVHKGRAVTAGAGVAVRYPFFGQIVDVSSIGSGGGSIAWVDEVAGVLKVGPQSAGAHPGPACYGRGGTNPTVTDANVVLGYINPAAFLGGTMGLDQDAAERVIAERVARPLGMTVVEAAQAIYRITNSHMADFLRKKTIENGYDPRTFDLFAYGGAGPVHASAFARELGVAHVIVPLGNVASVYSALGVLTSDIRHVFERTEPAFAPFDGQRLEEVFAELTTEATARLRADGMADQDIELRYSVDMRYAGQIYDVEVSLDGPVDDDAGATALLDIFDARYDELFGVGAGFREAGVELLMLRVTGIGHIEAVSLDRIGTAGGGEPKTAANGSRLVTWDERGPQDTETYDGEALGAGAAIQGPAVVELAHTSVVLHPGDRAQWRSGGTIEIEVGGADPQPSRPLADATTMA
ncbi:MAG: hydantoinase/oxoprolinase family protein [Solirubrobacteraceae bacterium]